MKYYIGPILWMGVMFFFSTDAGSADHTNAFFAPVIRFFVPQISRRELVIALISIRKAAHVIEYAILSFLWFNAFNQGKKGWRWRPIAGALAISILYAGLDEFHQTFVHSRTPSLSDVGIDSAGALLGQGALQLRRISSIRRSASGLSIGRSASGLSIKAKFFGWWFAWGVVSALLVLIVLRGGPFSFWKTILLVGAVGVLTGTAGVFYYARRD